MPEIRVIGLGKDKIQLMECQFLRKNQAEIFLINDYSIISYVLLDGFILDAAEDYFIYRDYQKKEPLKIFLCVLSFDYVMEA